VFWVDVVRAVLVIVSRAGKGLDLLRRAGVLMRCFTSSIPLSRSLSYLRAIPPRHWRTERSTEVCHSSVVRTKTELDFCTPAERDVTPSAMTRYPKRTPSLCPSNREARSAVRDLQASQATPEPHTNPTTSLQQKCFCVKKIITKPSIEFRTSRHHQSPSTPSRCLLRSLHARSSSVRWRCSGHS